MAARGVFADNSGNLFSKSFELATKREDTGINIGHLPLTSNQSTRDQYRKVCLMWEDRVLSATAGNVLCQPVSLFFRRPVENMEPAITLKVQEYVTCGTPFDEGSVFDVAQRRKPVKVCDRIGLADSWRSWAIPAFPDFLCLYVELADEYFTFQGKREDILHIQASMSECDITATLVMKTMRKVAPARPKKVIGAVGGPVGIAHVHGLAEERMRSDKEVVASIKSLNALKERAEILLRFAEDLRNSASGGKTMDALQRVCIAVGIESPVENVRGDAGLRQLATEFAEVIETVFKAGGTPPVLTKAESAQGRQICCRQRMSIRRFS